MRRWDWLLLGMGLLVHAGPGGGVAMAAGPAQEPVDPAVDKTSVIVNLQAGFVLDPYLLPVIGNGVQEATSVESGCAGYIDEGPDVTVNWSGRTDQLSFFVYSDDDAVLTVELPDGSVLCNDDAGLGTVQPLVEIAEPAPGTYRVYVGSAQQGSPALGALGIAQAKLDAATLAELDLTPMLRRKVHRAPPAQFDPNRLPNVPPAAGRGATLEPGFGAVSVLAVGGGDIAAVQTEAGALKCAGFANPIASYRFAWTGHGKSLRLFFESQAGSAMFVVGPDRKLQCGMGTKDNPSPILDLSGAKDGEYKVYMASLQPDMLVAGRLTITEDMSAEPRAVAGQGQ